MAVKLMYDQKFIDRFWSKVVVGKKSECWEWQAGLVSGYGRIRFRKSRGVYLSLFAHRVSWELAKKKTIPDGKFVLHSCDNPKCVNPAHLSVGTHLDNMKDRDKRGRTLRGSDSGCAVLTDRQVKAIRKASFSGESYASIARRMGVSRAAASQASHGRHWSHLPGRGEKKRAEFGEKHYLAKLNDELVVDILRRVASGVSMCSIARSLGMARESIRAIVIGRNWKHISRDIAV